VVVAAGAALVLEEVPEAFSVACDLDVRRVADRSKDSAGGEDVGRDDDGDEVAAAVTGEPARAHACECTA
jgi:hypothetical protein